MLVLAPTRELAIQTKEVVDNFDLFKVVCLYGGESRYQQVQYCKRYRPPIVVGTPGRINDLIDSSIIDVDQVKYLGKCRVNDAARHLFLIGFALFLIAAFFS